MNKERYNQIIDEAYENYSKYILSTESQNNKYEICKIPWPKEDFIKTIKGDGEIVKKMGKKYCEKFSEVWGLKIEERELSLEERGQWCQDFLDWDLVVGNLDHDHIREDVEENAPTKLITVTYKDEKTEVYES